MQIRLSYYPQLKVDHFSDVWLACLQSYLQALYDHSQSVNTVNAYVSELALAFEHGRLPDTLTRSTCEELIHRPLVKGPHKGEASSIATQNRRAAALNSFFSYAAGYIVNGRPLFDHASPLAGIRYGKPAVNYKYLQESEIRRFLSVIDRTTVIGARDHCLFLLFLTTARRRAELARLVWSDLEEAQFEDGHRGHIFKFTGKGRSMVLDSQEISQEVYDELIQYLHLSGRLASMESDSPLFLQVGPPHGGLPVDVWKPLSEASMADAMKRYLKAAGLPSHYSLHSWRHSSSRLRLAQGEDLRSVSQTLRHASLATTDRYARLLVTAADDSGSRLARRFAVEEPPDGSNILPLRRRG